MKNVDRAERMKYSDREAETVINSLNQGTFETPYKLVVLSGRNQSAKKSITGRIEGAIKEVDLRNVISTSEEESFQNIDSLFESLEKDNHVIYLTNGDVLSGEYTGHTYSHRRYATPQEKHLLRKVSESGRAILIEFTDNANVNSAIERHAHAIIECTAPQSGLGKLLWRLKNIRLHGHTFENRRPLRKQISGT